MAKTGLCNVDEAVPVEPVAVDQNLVGRNLVTFGAGRLPTMNEPARPPDRD